MNVFEFILAIIFMVVVVPVWVGGYYNHKNKKIRGLDDDDRKELDELLASVDQMLDRIETLENILHDNSPDWSQRRHGR